MSYTEEDWAEELATYSSVKQTIDQTLEGSFDHLNRECTTGGTRTVVTSGTQPRPPFAEEPTVCDRGSTGCTLIHNDLQALKFTYMGLERAKELLKS